MLRDQGGSNLVRECRVYMEKIEKGVYNGKMLYHNSMAREGDRKGVLGKGSSNNALCRVETISLGWSIALALKAEKHMPY